MSASLANEASATAVRPQTTARELRNPPQRLEIRADFPRTIDTSDHRKILKVIREELQKQGTTLEEAGRITFAYPHKHPQLFPNHDNRATRYAHDLRRALAEIIPSVRWVVADGLCETKHLARSENQTSVHALMNRQIYDIHKPAQIDNCPFFAPENDKKEFFVLVDSWTEQGTTLANLMSYIEYNGGAVLAAASACGEMPLAQQRTYSPKNAPLSKAFNKASKNIGRLPHLAKIFSDSAKESGFNWTPNACLQKLEKQLRKHGNSVFALTDGECNRLLETVQNRYDGHRKSFPSLLDNLGA